MTPGFVHLRLHTEYSLVDSVVRVPELTQAVAKGGMPAVAVTDQCNLFALVKFYREALKYGVQPIAGVDLLVREAGERAQPSRITLLCQSQIGYHNITRLISRAYLEGQRRGVVTIERSWLSSEETSGLIALSGAAEGDVGRALVNGREPEAERALDFWLSLFPDRYYFELQRVGRNEEELHIAAAVALAARRGVPVVATNDVRFLVAEDFESHEARVCIHEGKLLADTGRRRHYTPQQYLRTPQEMAALFEDIPEALANSVEIARRCSLVLKLDETKLPDFPTPRGESVEEYLRTRSRSGLQTRLASLYPDEAARVAEQPRYEERLEFELKTIIQMGFAGYFLIVADFINWAQSQGIPVGPGRGSGAGSLVAYVLGITGLDPLRYELLFERFLNPERVSMPDFDIDFCQDGRDRVIDYVKNKYGAECVSQIATFGTMAAKAVVRDVGRVLGMPFGEVDRIAKLVPFELGMTLTRALEIEPQLKALMKEQENVAALMDLALSLEGLTRNVGMHAGGVLIAPGKLTDFTPLYVAEDSTALLSQFDKDDVEKVGLVKFDFLGLTTLTIIAEAVRNIHALGHEKFDIEKIPLDDAATYQVFSAGNTVAIFQFESRGMRDLIMKARPDRLEDLIALNALYRPGPMDLIPEFIERKHGRQSWEYLDPRLKEILEPTYGVMTYQEHVMSIAQVVGGYTLGGADLLRRAMGKKKPEEMAKQRAIFLKGAAERGLSESRASLLFDQMEKFAGYGFNKSHAAAYAFVAYQTAYLKAHFPAAFMAANLSAVMNDTDKVVPIIRDSREIGLEILPPNINQSYYRFTVADEKTIRYGLGAVRGVGEGAVEVLIAEREARGAFASLEDLCRRIDLHKLNKRMLEALIRSGSLDGLATNRATLLSRLPEAMRLGDQNARASEAGQVDLFGLASSSTEETPAAIGISEQPEWSEAVRLKGERETLGLYLTGHPIDRFEADLARFVSHRINDLVSEKPVATRAFGGGRSVSAAGLIDEVRKRGSRTILILDDHTGRLEVTLFDEILQKHRDLIVKDALVMVEGKIRFDEFSGGWNLMAQRLTELDRLREQQARRIVLTWPRSPQSQTQLDRLMEILGRWRGGPCPITIEYCGSGAQGAFTLGKDWNVKPTRELIDQMEGLIGRDSVQIVYGAPPSLSQAAPLN